MTTKKLAILATLMALTAGAYAQGTIYVVNRISGSLYAPVYLPSPVNPAAVIQGQSSIGLPAGTTDYQGAGFVIGTGYTAELWGGPLGSAEASLQVATGPGAQQTFNTRTTAPMGYLAFNGQSAVIAGVAEGNRATCQLRVWDNLNGTVTSWAAATAISGLAIGKSALFDTAGLGGLGLPPNTDTIQSFNLQGIPEPSTMALVALGAGALLLIRRRK